MIRLLPYPGGKSFAFTIIDDTDGSTLEMVLPIYEYLFSLGLRTTKTVWLRKPRDVSTDFADQGDTVERKEYVEYLKLLQNRGFEIALHNVSSRSSKRGDIIAGIEKFKEIFGCYPKINVHHEKNKENLYFDMAQSVKHLPPQFHSKLFQKLYSYLDRLRGTKSTRDASIQVPRHGCSGENADSEYFWGDVCKATIKYVRTNVFFQNINTLRCNPSMPNVFMETPYVNYWFDSSNGQDVGSFNSILEDKGIRRLRKEKGCCILYTHFGKGFVLQRNGVHELNAETKERLEAIARCSDGWFAPVGDVLDRLQAFKSVAYYPFSDGIILKNDNPHNIGAVTLWVTPRRRLYTLDGEVFIADEKGRIIFPLLKADETVVLLNSDFSEKGRRWHDRRMPAWFLDMEKLCGKLFEHLRVPSSHHTM